MLTVEHPCREILFSYQNPTKPVITRAVAKKHLHDIRLQRQNQLATTISECHRLHIIHKQIYNRQYDSNPIETHREDKPINNEYPSRTNKYSIPRIEYASVIYRQAIPTFELETFVESQNDKPIIKELTQYLSESPRAMSNDQIKKSQSLSPIKHDRQRSLSVSSVSSIEKRANKVYEKWPDYNRISEIVGYRINPPESKIITSKSKSSRPSNPINRPKRNTSTKLPPTSKQKKTQRKTAKSKKDDVTPVIIDKPLSPTIDINNPIKEIQPKLPTILCPSSIAYSNRIQTRQWLIKTNFSSNTIRTLPLL